MVKFNYDWYIRVITRKQIRHLSVFDISIQKIMFEAAHLLNELVNWICEIFLFGDYSSESELQLSTGLYRDTTTWQMIDSLHIEHFNSRAWHLLNIIRTRYWSCFIKLILSYIKSSVYLWMSVHPRQCLVSCLLSTFTNAASHWNFLK